MRQRTQSLAFRSFELKLGEELQLIPCPQFTPDHSRSGAAAQQRACGGGREGEKRSSERNRPQKPVRSHSETPALASVAQSQSGSGT